MIRSQPPKLLLILCKRKMIWLWFIASSAVLTTILIRLGFAVLVELL